MSSSPAGACAWPRLTSRPWKAGVVRAFTSRVNCSTSMASRADSTSRRPGPRVGWPARRWRSLDHSTGSRVPRKDPARPASDLRERDKPFFRRRFESSFHALPNEAQSTRVQRLVRQNELTPLRFAQTALHEIEVNPFVSAVDLIPHNGMPGMGEMNANLMFATSARPQAKERIGRLIPCESRQPNVIRDRGRAVRPNPILDRDRTLFISPQGRLDPSLRLSYPTMNDGQVLFQNS